MEMGLAVPLSCPFWGASQALDRARQEALEAGKLSLHIHVPGTFSPQCSANRLSGDQR